MDVQVQGAADMQRFARSFISTLQPEIGTATVVALSRALGVEETVNSPTFVIEKIYALSHQKWQRLIHIDAYRLKSAEELRALGWERMGSDKNNLIVIECPENVAGAIPESAHRITIEIGEGEGRILKI